VGKALGGFADEDRPDVVMCSPYVRARETAAIACESSGMVPPVHVDERLRDRELGVLDALTEAGVAARHPEEQRRRRWQGKFYHRPAGGESWVDVLLRLRSWLAYVDGAWPGRRILVVSHDVVIVLLRYLCEGLDEEGVLTLARTTPVHNAALSRYMRDSDGLWTVPTYDDVEHLRTSGLTVTEHGGTRRAGT
jgi:broad specificity phosphatase PhoE